MLQHRENIALKLLMLSDDYEFLYYLTISYDRENNT